MDVWSWQDWMQTVHRAATAQPHDRGNGRLLSVLLRGISRLLERSNPGPRQGKVWLHERGGCGQVTGERRAASRPHEQRVTSSAQSTSAPPPWCQRLISISPFASALALVPLSSTFFQALATSSSLSLLTRSTSSLSHQLPIQHSEGLASLTLDLPVFALRHAPLEDRDSANPPARPKRRA